MAYLLFHSAPCPAALTGDSENWTELYLSCRPANEIGDFLAGAFAPVAFLWLVTTVVIQARELAEQRNGLELTRKEFEMNRAVTQLQADEARKQAEFIGEQTSLLRRERAEAEIALNDKMFESRVGSLMQAFSDRNNNQYYQTKSGARTALTSNGHGYYFKILDDIEALIRDEDHSSEDDRFPDASRTALISKMDGLEELAPKFSHYIYDKYQIKRMIELNEKLSSTVVDQRR